MTSGVVFDLADRISVLADGQVIASGLPAAVRADPAGARRLSGHGGGHAVMSAGGRPLLEVSGLDAWYGKSQVLRGVELQIGRGEIVAILGRNGAGRSTALKAIMGAVQRRGQVLFDGVDISRMSPHAIARRGLGYVPEDRAIFPDLTTLQNLVLGEKRGPGDPFMLADAYTLFPAPAGARGSTRGRPYPAASSRCWRFAGTMMGCPALVMVDEPTEGLAPMMVERVRELLEAVAARGTTILLVEQKLAIALAISQRLYVMGHGRVVFEGTPAAFAADAAVQA